MMKTKKLNLNNLKVESFVTSLTGENSQTLKGGSSAPCGEAVLSAVLVVAATAVAVVVATKVKSVVAEAENKLKNYTTNCYM